MLNKTTSAVYVVIDLESYPRNDVWQAFGAVAVMMPECSVVSHYTKFCDRSEIVERNDDNIAFWKNNDNSFQYNMTNGAGINVENAERDIVNYLCGLKQNFPHFYLVSDCPSFDIRLVNNMMVKHGHTALADRGSGIYHQAICTWSTRQTLQMLLGISSKELKQLITTFIKKQEPTQLSLLANNCGLVHTPLADAYRILSNYFDLLDFSRTQLTCVVK